MATTTPSKAKQKQKSQIIKLKVHFELNTPNGLRKVIFGLEKDATAANLVKWSIEFQLFERSKKTDPWGDAIVTLNVDIDKKLFPKAELAAQGLTPPQTAHAIGPAADDAAAAANGEIDQEEAEDTVQNTLNQ
jgi:hypothetical protein